MLLLPLRRSFVILTALVCAWVGPMLRAQSATDGFNPTVSGNVNAIVVQPTDSKVIIGGSFNALQPNGASNQVAASGLARLNPDGTVDTTYSIPALSLGSGVAGSTLGAQINVLALQDDGKLLVGGNFNASGQLYLARLNANGTLDTAFAPKLTGAINGVVTAITYVPKLVNNVAVPGAGQILIGGNFNSIQSGSAAAITRAHVARLNVDGTVDTTFDPETNGQVDAFAVQSDGSIIIGGGFTTVNPFKNLTASATVTLPVRNYIARFLPSGQLDTTYDPNANNQVAAMVLQLDGKLLIAGGFTALTPLQPDGSIGSSTSGFIARINPNGTVDTSFTTQSSENITTMVLKPDGKILVGGNISSITNFTTGALSLSNLAQLNYDGSPDTTFTPGLNQPATAIAIQPDGKIVIGGIFTQVRSAHTVNSIARMGIARLGADGTLDTDFNPAAFGGIGVIVVDGSGKYLVGGSFSSINGVTCRNLARLLPSGQLDPTFFKSNPDAPVSSLVIQSDGRIIIAGLFSHLTANATSGDLAVSHLARLNTDGTQDTSYLPEPGGSVLSVILQPDGRALVGGNFASFTHNDTDVPISVTDLARVNTDGTVDLSFEPNPAGTIHSMVLDGTSGYVVVAGEFASETPTSNLYPTSIAYLGRFNLKDGTIDTTWTPSPDSFVYTVVRQNDGKFVYGGIFRNVTPEGAATDPTSGLLITTPRPYMARANANGGLDTTFNPAPDNDVQRIALDANQNILVGGLFKTIGGKDQPYLARLLPTGVVDATINARPNAVVDVVTPLSDGSFLAGGAFTSIQLPSTGTTVAANHLARFGSLGTYDSTLNLTGSVNGTITALALEPNGQLLVAGAFSNIAGVFAANIARFYNDGSFDTVFGPNPDGQVNTMVVESNGSSIYVGGSFSTISGGTAQNFARINSDASFDASFSANPQGVVNAAAPQADGKMVIGGSFTGITSIFNSTTAVVPIANLARVAGADGVTDLAFNPKVVGAVNAIAIQNDGKILIGGAFTSVGGVSRNFLARLLTTGALDTSFAPVVTGGAVNAIAVLPDNRILIGGAFTSVGGSGQAYLALLTAAGAVDPSLALVPNAAVNAVVLENTGSQNGDSIVIGGNFTTLSGTTRNHLARLLSASATSIILDAAYNPNVDNTVNTVAFGFDGKSYIGGSFGSVGGLSRLAIARISATGGSSSVITTNSSFNQFTWKLSGEVPEINDIVFQVSSDGVNYNTIGSAVRQNADGSATNTNTWTLVGTPSVPSGDIFIRALADAVTTQYGSQSEFTTVQHFYGVPVSAVQSSPNPVGAVGVPFYYEIAATNNPTSIAVTGLPPGLTVNTALGIISGTPTTANVYPITIKVSNANGNVVTSTITLTVNAAAAPANTTGRLLNISTRGTVSQANDLEAGFTISGSSPKTVLLRAIGPALGQFGVSLPLDQPILTLFNANSQAILTAQGTDPSAVGSAVLASISTSVGAFPISSGSKDTAVVTILQPNQSYTIHVTTGDGYTGTSLVEVYDADQNVYASPSTISNISTHGLVDSNGKNNAGDFLVGGFVVGGSSSRKVLIRGIGPALNFFGLNGLVDPQLVVYQGTVPIASNNGFGNQVVANPLFPIGTLLGSNSDVVAAFSTTGAFPLTPGSNDAAVLLTLAPGAYTALLTSTTASTGIAQFEAFDAVSP